MAPDATTILDHAGETLGDYLPRIGGSLAVLVLGLILARLLTGALRRVLLAIGLDALSERLHVHDALARAGLERSATRLLTFSLRLALSIAVIFAAISLLGIQALDDSLNQGILFLPRLIAALAVILVGIVLGSLARERVERIAYQMDLQGPLGPVTQGALLAIAAVTALGQVGVPTEILIVLAGIVTASAALTFTLAFGLGSRELAREISTGRYVTNAFQIGDNITIGTDRGELIALEPTFAVLQLPDGDTVQLPNHLFLQQRVQVHATASKE